MKKIILAIAFTASTSAFAADVCTQKDGSLIYDSATTVGNSVVVVNPKLLLAGGAVAIAYDSGAGICKTLGFKAGAATDGTYISSSTLIAKFDSNGILLGVGRDSNLFAASILTCQK